MGDVARSLDREHEAGRGLVAPAGEAVGLQEAIEGAVDLYRREAPGGKAKLALSVQLFWVEHAPPASVGPAGNVDAHLASRHCGPTPVLLSDRSTPLNAASFLFPSRHLLSPHIRSFHLFFCTYFTPLIST